MFCQNLRIIPKSLQGSRFFCRPDLFLDRRVNFRPDRTYHSGVRGERAPDGTDDSARRDTGPAAACGAGKAPGPLRKTDAIQILSEKRSGYRIWNSMQLTVCSQIF